jgi:transposase InsO family protein
MDTYSKAKALGVSRSSLYYEPKQPHKDWVLLQQILEVMRNNPSYGYRRVAQTLSRNHKPVQRVMQMNGIKAYRRSTKKPFKRPSKQKDLFPNLLLMESPQGLSDIYATDFTYLKWQKKTLYVSTILDLFTREIVSCVVLTTHATPLVLNTLLQAIHDRPPPRIIHSDQGSEYTSLAYQSLCTDLGISQSMSRRGCPWENGFQESWYDKFKKELGDPNRYTNLGELSAVIYHSITYYNHRRIHSALKMSPKQFASQFILRVQ